MKAPLLRRAAQFATIVFAVVIVYVMLAAEPPHWGTFTANAESTPTATGLPPKLAPPPGWTTENEEMVGHTLLFALLGFSASLWYATSDAARRSPRRAMLMVLAALWLFGGLTEYAQGFTPTRSPQLSDLAFDVLGAFAGFLGGGLVWRLLLTRRLR